MQDNRKKVLIFTLQGYFNYGNRLQNFALSLILRKMGYRVSTYNQNSFKHRLFDYLTFHTPLRFLNSGNPRLYRFTQKYIKNDYSTRNNPDYIIVGSDQVWNPDYLSPTHSPLHIQNECDRVISYAASIGKTNLSTKEKKLFLKYLPEYSSIAVREKNAKSLLAPLTDKHIEMVLDPTLLVNKAEWLKIANRADQRKLPKGKYIFNYVLGDKTDISDAEKYAQENNYSIVSLSDREKSAYGVEEFLALINGADLICTDSFHACVFSFLFDKPFVVYKRNNNDELYQRIRDLLKTLRINNRESNGSSINIKSVRHDYRASYLALNDLIDKSIKYLKTAMD